MSLDKHLFNLKFAAKELERNSRKCKKQEKEEKAKLTAAIKQGNMEVAQVHAENAIRKKNEGINYMRMSARIDAVASRVQTAATQKRITTSMAGVVKAMESAMSSMNLEKVSNLMDRFERDFENLDVQSATMEGSMNATTTLNAPQAEVNALIQEAADKAGFVMFNDTWISMENEERYFVPHFKIVGWCVKRGDDILSHHFCLKIGT
ncbi:hypothetical protein AB6A40_005428 [Gnathostoma spinigerum]|uniref:Charged multivesicular body protein 1b n=1 Tax=Gnathostoma spinigerum TaxID=75299 RepID=A0ABD6EFF1_9BILA